MKHCCQGLKNSLQLILYCFNSLWFPQDTAETLAARQGFANLGQTAAGFAPDFQQLYQADLARGLADPSQDSLFLAETGTIADQARRLTERDKLLAQTQAIEAGQFGMGSTALEELQQNQARNREETVQQQLAASLGRAEQRRIGAADRAPGVCPAATTGTAGTTIVAGSFGQRPRKPGMLQDWQTKRG